MRAIVYDARSGAKLTSIEEALDPAKKTFDFQLPIPVAGGPVTTRITIELAFKSANSEVVEYSGRRVDIRFQSGDFRQIDIDLFPGPLDNLDATGVAIVEPLPARVEGATYQATATIQGNATSPRVAWSSLDTTIATISTSGEISAVLPGTARIVAGVASHADTATIQVLQRRAGVVVTPAAAALDRRGDTVMFVAKVVDPRGTEILGEAVVWSMANTAVATTGILGRVEAVAEGSTILAAVAAADTAIKGAASVQVASGAARVATLVLSPADTTLQALGATVIYSAVARDRTGSIVTGLPVTWSSSSAGVASVSSGGIATALANGTSNVTAQSDGITATAVLRVSQVASLGKSTLSANPTSVLFGGTSAITVTLKDANGNTLSTSGGTVALSTTTGTLSSVTDNGDGTYRATLTGSAAGIATITGKLGGAALDATASVTVGVGVTAPSAPTITGITAGNGQLSVAFSAPSSDGGAAITNYEYSTDGGVTWTVLSPAATSGPITIAALTNGTTYPVKLRAVNSVGSGTPSAAVNGMPAGTAPAAAAATAPGAPTITGITPGDGQLSVAFTAPSSNGGAAITNYEYSTDNGTSWVTLSPAATTSPIAIASLTNGTTYQVKLRAVNSVGAGAASPAVAGTPTAALTIPSAPTITGITAGNGQLSVAFSVPSSNGGAAITNYEYSTDNGTSWVTLSPATTTSPIVIGSLTNGTTYQVKLRAVNSVGTGTASSVTNATPATTPGAPTITGITPGDAQLSVAFTAPSSNGGAAITNYEYSTDGGTNWTTRSPTSASSPLVITGLTNGTTYQVQLRAVNAAGNGAATGSTSGTPATVPGAPTNLAGTPASGSVSLTWTAPASNGGSSLTDYLVEFKLTSAGTYTTFSDGVSTTAGATVTGLTNNQSYDFRLSAINAVGTGATSSVLTMTAGTPSAPPITGITASNGQLSVAFTTPSSDGGSTITNYEYSVDDGTNWTVRSPTSTSSPLVITGLTNGTTYPVRLRAVNAIGVGTASAATNGTPATTPGAPTITGITGGDGQLSVAFSAPANNGGSAITNYEYSTDGGANWTTRSPTRASSPVVITGLTNGTTYQVQLRAVNTVGIGAATGSTSGTPATVPGAPTNLAGTPASGSVSLTWTAPTSNGGSSLTDYVVEFKLTSAGTYTTFSDGVSTTTSATVTGLTNNQSYDFRVSATNAVGTGAASATTTLVPGAPTAPVGPGVTFNQIDATNHTANLSWTVPSSNGGSAITDYVIQYKTSASGTYTTFADGVSTATTAAVTGLGNLTTYNFRIAAKNSVGTGPYSNVATGKTTGPSEKLACSTPGIGNSSGDATTIAPCSGVVTGDIVVIPVSINNSSTTTAVTVTAPTGFVALGTELNGTFQTTVFYKIVTASEPASYAFSWTGNVKFNITLVAYKGVSGGAPTYSAAHGTSSPITAPTLPDPGQAAYTLIYIFTPKATMDDTTPSLSEWTITSDLFKNTTAGANNNLAIAVLTADVDRTGAGAVSARTATTPGLALNSPWNAAVLVIHP